MGLHQCIIVILKYKFENVSENAAGSAVAGEPHWNCIGWETGIKVY